MYLRRPGAGLGVCQWWVGAAGSSGGWWRDTATNAAANAAFRLFYDGSRG